MGCSHGTPTPLKKGLPSKLMGSTLLDWNATLATKFGCNSRLLEQYRNTPSGIFRLDNADDGIIPVHHFWEMEHDIFQGPCDGLLDQQAITALMEWEW